MAILLFLSNSGDTESVDYLEFVENFYLTVIVPKGAASPEVDTIKLMPAHGWYVPSQISVNQNDTVTWINRDTEVHTVTSGIRKIRTSG